VVGVPSEVDLSTIPDITLVDTLADLDVPYLRALVAR